MRIVGLDPGLQRTGWGMIETDGSRLTYVASGTCLSEGIDLPSRLLSLHRQISDVLSAWVPSVASIEQTFVNRDGAGTLKLGQARGVALLSLAQAGLSIGEYAPNAVKKTVVGVGHADKRQIAHMVRLLLPGASPQGPDAADALAVALCHAAHLQGRSARIRA